MDPRARQPVFTGAELAIADLLAGLIEVLIANQAIPRDRFEALVAELRERYGANQLASSSAMIDYIYRHATRTDDADQYVRTRGADIDPEKGKS